jgi:hypothetical protein
MTDTPERIALRWQPGDAVTSGPLMDHPDFTQWVRADVAAAMVAAEREACAATAVKVGKDAYEAHRMAQGHELAVKTATAVLSRQMLALAAAIRKRGQ